MQAMCVWKLKWKMQIAMRADMSELILIFIFNFVELQVYLADEIINFPHHLQLELLL